MSVTSDLDARGAVAVVSAGAGATLVGATLVGGIYATIGARELKTETGPSGNALELYRRCKVKSGAKSSNSVNSSVCVSSVCSGVAFN